MRLDAISAEKRPRVLEPSVRGHSSVGRGERECFGSGDNDEIVAELGETCEGPS